VLLLKSSISQRGHDELAEYSSMRYDHGNNELISHLHGEVHVLFQRKVVDSGVQFVDRRCHNRLV
jgi:hypothetical protein